MVIAIIAILIALLLPAVQAARRASRQQPEAARIAVQNYADVNGGLAPTSTSGPNDFSMKVRELSRKKHMPPGVGATSPKPADFGLVSS